MNNLKKYFSKVLTYNLGLVFFQKIHQKYNIPISKPDEIQLEITHRCNSHCITCNHWKNTSSDNEIDLIEIKKTTLKLKKWLGNYSLIITGGEPLIRSNDVINLIRHLNKNNIHHHLCTNALSLDKITMDRLIKAGLTNISISLNSLDPKIHNKTRGTEGSHKKATEAIEYLHTNNVLVTVDSIIIPDHIDDSIELVKWVQQKGYDSIFINVLQPVKKSNEKIRIQSPKEQVKHLEKLKNLKNKGFPISNSLTSLDEGIKSFLPNYRLKCSCDVRRFAIQPNGDVKLCAKKGPVGNIKNQNPKTIWYSNTAKTIRSEIKSCTLSCDPTGGLSCSSRKNLLVDLFSLIKRKIILK